MQQNSCFFGKQKHMMMNWEFEAIKLKYFQCFGDRMCQTKITESLDFISSPFSQRFFRAAPHGSVVESVTVSHEGLHLFSCLWQIFHSFLYTFCTAACNAVVITSEKF